jgi:hypothetical protein
MNVLALIAAALGAFVACALLITDGLGYKTPASWPIREHMWGQFALLCLSGVVWLVFSNM